MYSAKYLYPLLLSSLLVGCATNTGTGVLVGAGSGAVIGGIAGGGTGALIGVAVGSVAGGLIGAYLDDQQQRNLQSSPATVQRMDQGAPLTVQDVIKLHQGGVSDETIIRYINDHGAVNGITGSQIQRLQDAGVSQDVIDEMRRGEG